MKQSEAKSLIIRLYRQWAKEKGRPIPNTDPEGGYIFYQWLRANHPEALSFQSRANKWQLVHIWLREAGAVTQ